MASSSSNKFITESLLSEIKCPVCLEITTLHVLAKCQHRLCQTCIDYYCQWDGWLILDIDKVWACSVSPRGPCADEQLADNQDFESPLYGLSAYRSLRRQRHLVCPECRADVTVPSEGFPVCRLTESIRENFERAQSQASEIPVKQPEKKKVEFKCTYCEKKISFYCEQCKNILCSRCMLKTECSSADDRKHDGPDMDELLEQKEKQSAQWMDNTQKRIFDLNNKKIEIERRYNSEMAAIREEIQLHEESLEEFSDGLEVKENKLEKIFYIDEQLNSMFLKLAMDKAAGTEAQQITEPALEEPMPLCTELKFSRQVEKTQCFTLCHTTDGQLVVGKMNGINVYNKQMTEITASLNSVWEPAASIAWKYGQVYVRFRTSQSPEGASSSIQVYNISLEPLRSFSVATHYHSLSTVGSSLYLTNPFIKSTQGSALMKVSLEDGNSMGEPVCAAKLSNPSIVKPYKDEENEKVYVVASATELNLCTDNTIKWKTSMAGITAVAVEKDTGHIWTLSNSGRERIIKIFSEKGDKLRQMTLPVRNAWMMSVCDMSISGSKLYVCASKDGLLEYDIL